MKVFTLSACEIGATVFGEVISSRLSNAIQKFANRSGGYHDVSFVGGMSKRPMFSFSTHAIKKSLDLTAFGIYDFSSSSAALYLKQIAGSGFEAASGNHIKVTVDAGMAVMRRLSCTHGGEAVIDWDVFMKSSDGDTAPYTWAENASLPAGYSTAAAKWTLGNMTIGGTDYDYQSLTIDSGITELVIGSNGKPYPMFTGGLTRESVVQVSSLDPTLMNIVGLDGGPQANATFILQKLVDGDFGRVAAVTEEHISIVLPSSYVYPEDVDSQSGRESTIGLTFCAKWNGTAGPFTVDTTSAA